MALSKNSDRQTRRERSSNYHKTKIPNNEQNQIYFVQKRLSKHNGKINGDKQNNKSFQVKRNESVVRAQ